MSLTPTASATTGPFFPPRYIDAGCNDLTRLDGRAARGEPIEIHGRVLQEDGAPLENLIVEIWQADAGGVYGHPADPRIKEADPDFFGWGRTATDADGAYRFRSVLPGARAPRARHVNFQLMFSGMMRALPTVMYFEGQAGNDADPVLAAVPAARRALLVARRERADLYRFDIRLRGEGETPFFEL
jgi:protocatechuate 3,4-dioxygenase alpha subunit